VRYFKGKDIDSCCSQNKFILLSNSSLISIKKCQEFSTWWLIILLVFLLFSIFFLTLFSFLLICLSLINFWCFCLNTEISNFFFIPIKWNRNMILSEIIANKSINLSIINMETVVYCWSCVACIVGDYSYLFPISIDSTTSDISNQSFWIFKPSWCTNLFYFWGKSKYSNIRLLSPTNEEIIINFYPANFSLTLRENKSLLYLTH